MPKATPFHEKTSALCKSMRWKDWGGFFSVMSYDTNHDSEYASIRYSVGLMDVTPLFKYDVTGVDAAAFLSRVIAKNISKLKVGQVTYCCWTDEHGKMLDDGTVTRLSENHFRLTAAEPSYHWFARFRRGFTVDMKDITEEMGALALQGPYSRELLKMVVGPQISDLKFFWSQPATIAGHPVVITRTGYTGDLGYEIWVHNSAATKVYETLMFACKSFGISPFGLDALDVTRVEAGFIMNGVDYYSANHCIIESRKSTPFELGLGWTVQLEDREPFIGMEALKREKERGSEWAFVGLVLDWEEQEKLFAQYGLPPQICSHAWRSAVPVFDFDGQQIGKATSGAWSPVLKKNLALATVQAGQAVPGTELQMEYTVEFHRHKVKATVTKTPFFNPERKRS
ncbi:MAG: aminomethyltransferase family protein [Bdellovibrionales bacterium]|nr:aminomethyltransferase family protein [Bdellovibrionales bacterium]